MISTDVASLIAMVPLYDTIDYTLRERTRAKIRKTY